MEQDGKKVLVPWDEYQELLKDSEALKEARQELYKDCEERGLYVKQEVVFLTDMLQYCNVSTLTKHLNPRLSIYSKEEVLELASSEMARISLSAKTAIEGLEHQIERLKNRNLWDRIWNKV